MSATELCKEFAVGAVAGLGIGLALKKLLPLASSTACVLAIGAFVCLRFAVFDGHCVCEWSPLLADDASMVQQLKRTARRKAM